MKKLFGTDGIRGTTNQYPITPEIALKVGKAIAFTFGNSTSKKVIIGRDTRISGDMLELALTSGLISMGMNVISVGVIPTPGVAYLTKSMETACGIMITASHNPADDNGIKIFNSDGFKLTDNLENQIENLVLGDEINCSHIKASQLGYTSKLNDASSQYIKFAKESIKNKSLAGLKIVLDCANGSGSNIAPTIFRELGAEILTIATTPDGLNINQNCGATATEQMSTAVRQHNADLGIALDGDADRVIFCDSTGTIVNGDKIIALVALDYKELDKLSNNTVVVTSMTNLGLHKAMSNAGINVIVSDVGDRYVIEEMKKANCNIGGEQSGHIIFMDYVTTGDGIITALHILTTMQRKNKTLAELALCMEEFPQLLTNMPVKEKKPIEECPKLLKVINESKKLLGENGRVIIRYSGTENKIRILVESIDSSLVDKVTANISTIIKEVLR